jgi:hypothetical protein
MARGSVRGPSWAHRSRRCTAEVCHSSISGAIPAALGALPREAQVCTGDAAPWPAA